MHSIYACPPWYTILYRYTQPAINLQLPASQECVECIIVQLYRVYQRKTEGILYFYLLIDVSIPLALVWQIHSLVYGNNYGSRKLDSILQKTPSVVLSVYE